MKKREIRRGRTCDCRRSPKGQPKIVAGMCHAGYAGGYHPCVRERIRGKKLCYAMRSAIDRDDVELLDSRPRNGVVMHEQS